jgi:predicted permease
MTRSLLKLLDVDLGFVARDVVALQMLLPARTDSSQQFQRLALHDRILSELRSRSHVIAAGGVSVLPLAGDWSRNGRFVTLTRPDEITTVDEYRQLSKDTSRTANADFRIATPGYFRAMGIPITDGRDFSENDEFSSPHVAIVSASLARQRWPGVSPIGRLVQFGNMDGDLHPFTIIGVVGDVRDRSVSLDARPTLYANARQRLTNLRNDYSIVFRMDVHPSAAEVKASEMLVRSIAPNIPVRAQSIEQVLATNLADRRFALLLVAAFSVVALGLAVIGVYGVVAYLVSQRYKEFGIKLALGARPGMLIRGIAMDAVKMTGVGVLLGLGLAVLGARVLSSLMYGISVFDIPTFLIAGAALLLAAIIATLFPASQVARMNPVEALRAE